MSPLAGRTVVVTGAGSGIGAAVTAAVTAAGGHVVAVDRVAGAGIRRLDVRVPQDWSALVADLAGEPVHGLVNCAGVTWRARLGDVTPDASYVTGAEIPVDGGVASHAGAKPVSDALRPLYQSPQITH
jgi:3alpha(or 20beta)-hydroxysteroid dehydrogenase